LNLGKAEAPLVSVNLATVPPSIVLRRLPDAGDWDRTAASLLPNDPGQKLDHNGISLTVDCAASARSPAGFGRAAVARTARVLRRLSAPASRRSSGESVLVIMEREYTR
jgi:hypothetical protein